MRFVQRGDNEMGLSRQSGRPPITRLPDDVQKKYGLNQQTTQVQQINAQDQSGGGYTTKTPDFSTFKPAVQGQQTAVQKTTNPVSAATSTGNPSSEGQGQFYSPELENLKHAFGTRDWFGQTEYGKQLQTAMGGLLTPVTGTIGLSDRERQAIYNQSRSNIQSATKAMMGELGGQMAATRGLRAGESGVADSAMGQLARQGAEQLGQFGSQIAIDEANNRFNQGMQLENLNLQRLLGAGKFGEILTGIDQGNAGLGLQALNTMGGLEQFAKQLQAQQDQSAAAGSRAADAEAWDRERWQKEFDYQQQMDALKLLFGYQDTVSQNQNSRYQPYWSGLASTY